ncbi:ABC transporter permease [Cohnella hongkongensis]|uniref:ABC transporter permease n=1 Tax=Cohnella hongkongensis TaxID=178337 RepID=A0ABV9F9X8_9BACL
MPHNQSSKGRFQRNRELFLLSVPALLYKLLFFYLPLVFLIIAFKNYRYDLGLWGSAWVGFENFKFFFVSNAGWLVTRNTVLYNLAFMALTTVCALALAVGLNELKRRWVKLHQTVLFLPYFLSWVVVGYIVLGFLDHQNGVANQLLLGWGSQPVSWYRQAEYWPFILVLVHLWKSIGFATLIYFSGILGIDSSYYEAARIDGASRPQMVLRITLPLLTPLVVILLIIEMGKIFRADFGMFYFVPNDVSFLYNATDVIDTYVYRSLRVVGNLGMSTAVGLYQSVVGLLLVLLSNYVVKKINEENALW